MSGLRRSRREFIATVGAFSAIGGWYRPAWADTDVWVPPAERKIRVIENTWIEMPDGVKLAARIILPEDAETKPVGAILDYHGYTKRRGPRRGDDRTAAWLVPRGFALVRVDVRGTGESGGIIVNEYDLPEQADAGPVIRWISQQPWCNGNVGMRGISYSAITAYQAAAKAIPELKAIIAAMGTENGYTDDVHTLGGCILNEKVIWGTLWKRVMTNPPDPAIVGDRWQEMWLERLEAQIPLVSEWMRHQLVDEYWRNRILTDYSKVKCAVYAVGGLEDSYINTVPRVLERLSSPRKGIIGPWGHQWPQGGDPGPKIDWAVEETRWWDHWLNGHDNGIMNEPMLRSYVAEATTAQSYPGNIPGRWVADETWPPARSQAANYVLSADGSLSRRQMRRDKRDVPGDVTIGTGIPLLSPMDMASQAPSEQSVDDDRSLIFETAPLAQDIDIVGQPMLQLRFVSDKAVAKISARLNEVTPDGRSWLLTYGVRNLAHNADHTAFLPIAPGVEHAQVLVLNHTSRRVKKGSRIRLSVSQNQWPIVWPTPEAVNLQVVTGISKLDLPIRPARSSEAKMPIPTLPQAAGRPVQGESVVERPIRINGSPGNRQAVFMASQPLELELLEPTGMRIGDSLSIDATVNDGDVNSYRIAFSSEGGSEREGWKAVARVETTMTSTPREFIVEEGIEATLNGEKLFARRWFNRVPRNGN